MGTYVITDLALKAMLDQLDTLIGATGRIGFYAGVEGSDVALIPQGTLLATMILASPAFGAGTSVGTTPNTGVEIVLNTETPATPVATDVIGSFAIYNSATLIQGNMIIKGNVTTTAVGTGIMTLDNTSVTNGGGAIDLTEANCKFNFLTNVAV